MSRKYIVFAGWLKRFPDYNNVRSTPSTGKVNNKCSYEPYQLSSKSTH